MSELRDRYDRGAVSGQITQPPFADLTDQARRRAQRNRTARLAGVALLAALVSVPLLTLQRDGGDVESGRFPNVQFPDDFYGTGGMSYTLTFYDPRRGFATYTGNSCDTSWLSVTRDGGETWSELREVPGTRRLPAPEGFRSDWACSDALLLPASTETLIALVGVDTRPGYEWVDPPTTAFISHDAGLTWQEYEPQVRTVEAMPDGVAPSRRCEDDLCETMRLGWHDPLTGDRMVLQDNPPDLASRAGPTVATDGSIWVTGVDPGGDYRVWVSRDQGQSWQDRTPERIEDAGDPDRGTVFATHDGSTGYLSTPGSAGSGMPGALYRTADGGESWQRLPHDQPTASILDLRVAPDGTVVAADGTGGHHASSDGGESFRGVDLPVSEVNSIAGGWFGWALDDSAEDPIAGYVSEDGITWQPVRIPRP